MTETKRKRDRDVYVPDHQDNEALDNRYVANIHVCFFLVCLAVLVLTELGLYSQTVLRQMRIGTAIMLVITLAVQILGRVPSLAASERTKYCIIALTLVETLVFTSVLNFMALLVLCIPILVAMNYRSSKLALRLAIHAWSCHSNERSRTMERCPGRRSMPYPYGSQCSTVLSSRVSW